MRVPLRLKMAQAFAAFANNGVMVEAHAIKEIKKMRMEKQLEKWKKKIEEDYGCRHCTKK
ncbi:hypothetical protein GCM10020331_083950 [Ectobacillus funiculus]